MIEIVDSNIGVKATNVVCEGDRITATIAREPMTRADWTTHDYNVHFCIGLRNSGAQGQSVLLLIEGVEWDALPSVRPLIYTASDPDGPFMPADIDGRTDLGKRYALKLDLRPGSTLFVANMLPRSSKLVLAEAEKLAVAGGAKKITYGKSLDGHDLIAWRYGDPALKATVLVTSGFHPPEPDTWATRAILDWLSRSESAPLREQLSFMIVPVANPDGYDRRTQAANAAGINFYWDFARDRPELCPEAAALWALAMDVAPRGYVDFHGYTFQLRKKPGPYVKPMSFYNSPQVRDAANLFCRRLLEYPGTKAVRGFSSYAPQTLGAMLTETFDTITAAKYHIHLAEGPDASGARAIAVVGALADALVANQLTRPAVRQQPMWRTPVRRAREIWAGLIRPQIGLIRRGRLGELRLDRAGLDAASES
jgi:hypothetical protein